MSHSVDISPDISVPMDMPLEDGRFSCITCHYVHPFSSKFNIFTYSLLRRPGKGKIFCNACHGFNENDHIVFENLHMESYQVGDMNSLLDTYTLQCIECHDEKIDADIGLVNSEKWQHNCSLKLNHPIGVSYIRVSNLKPRKFNHWSILSPEIRLVNDKIGCGTCHNAYSKNNAMLVRGNSGSRLCLACHIK